MSTEPAHDDIPWGLLVTRSTISVLSEVLAGVGESTVWTFLPPFSDEQRAERIAEITSLLAHVAMSDARKARAKP